MNNHKRKHERAGVITGLISGSITTTTFNPIAGIGMGIVGYGIGKKNSMKWCKKCNPNDPFIK